MNSLQVSVSVSAPRRVATIVTLCASLLAGAGASAGGLIAYELGTADVGLASAGYGARAQDASTAFTNPAGMTRLEGTQILAAGQLLYNNTEFTNGSGTSPALGTNEGGKIIGSDGFFVGGGAFASYSLSTDLKLGFAMTGNFGAPMSYDDDWVGRYYVQETTLLGISFLPSIAYRLNEHWSVGGSVTAMYGTYTNQVAINNIVPSFGDGQLKMDDSTWGWGANLGLLYEISADNRIGLTWNSEVDLDFKAPLEFSGLAPGIENALGSAGLLTASLEVDMKVPQQVMLSSFSQINQKWAILSSLGWQEWSRFGQIQLGIIDTSNPSSVSTDLDFKDTWHGALGAQYRINEPWMLNFGMAYDSDFQSGTVSLQLPVNSAWRFGLGAERKLSKTAFWGFAAEYMYGGTLDTNLQSTAPVVLGGRGNVVGSYKDISSLFAGVYGNWTF